MEHSPMHKKHYGHLALMTVLSFVSMYILMYAMVNITPNVFSSYNQFYMAGLMTSPMVFIEMILMRMMYPNKKLNAIIICISILLGVVFFILIRHQSLIGDKQFLRSMIPHHAGAILMCENAPIQDQEIKSLCRNILSGQQKEIDQMKAILNRLE